MINPFSRIEELRNRWIGGSIFNECEQTEFSTLIACRDFVEKEVKKLRIIVNSWACTTNENWSEKIERQSLNLIVDDLQKELFSTSSSFGSDIKPDSVKTENDRMRNASADVSNTSVWRDKTEPKDTQEKPQ